MALYSEKVMDHFSNPRNVGKIEDADGVGEVGNAKCGDIMKMYIKVEDGVIVDCKFNTFGCGSAIATSSMATELIKGKKVEDALKLSNQAVVEALDGLPAQKIHCSVLAEEAVRAAVKDYYDKNGIAYDPNELQGPGKIQFGSGWWFLDQHDGMRQQLKALSNLGLLSRFVGMLTDSRSFLSYPRHEYFRRTLCNLVGTQVEKGMLPASEMDFIGKMIENISYNNAKEYFKF